MRTYYGHGASQRLRKFQIGTFCSSEAEEQQFGQWRHRRAACTDTVSSSSSTPAQKIQGLAHDENYAQTPREERPAEELGARESREVLERKMRKRNLKTRTITAKKMIGVRSELNLEFNRLSPGHPRGS